MSLYEHLNALDMVGKRDLIHSLSKSIIKEPSYNQQTVLRSLSVIETIVGLNTVYDFDKVNLIVDNNYKNIVQKALEAYFNVEIRYSYLSSHPSDALGVSLAIALESNLKTIVLMDDFSMNYGKSFESLIQIGNHNPDLTIVFFDPHDSFANKEKTINSWIKNIRMSGAYVSLKNDVKSILDNPIGLPLLGTLSKVKEGFKDALIEPSVFTPFGFNYNGPINGHKLEDNIKILKSIKNINGKHIVHIRFDMKSLNNLQLPSFKLEVGIPDDYISYLDAFDGALTDYDDVIVCADISKDREHMAQFAIKFPDHYYVSTGTIQSFVDFAKGLLMLGKKVVFFVSSYQFKHAIPLIEEQLNNSKNILFVLRDSGLNEAGNRVKQGIFDIGHSALITDHILMGRNLNESVTLLRSVLSQDTFDLSILRIPHTSERMHPSVEPIVSPYELLNKEIEPKAVIFTYGPTAAQVFNKIVVNKLDVWVVDCKNILQVDHDILRMVNSKNIPVVVYDLEDMYHTLYSVLERALNTDRIYNFSLKNTELNMSARDLKTKYKLNVDHILEVIK